MLHPLSFGSHTVRRSARTQARRWVVRQRRHLVNALRGPLQAGVLLEPHCWHVVLNEFSRWGLLPHRSHHPPHSVTSAPYRAWSPGALPDQSEWQLGLPQGSGPGHREASWRAALHALGNLVPDGACHLTLAWPDELLWAGTVTLPGPLSPAEVPAVLEQELAQVLPVPLHQVAWDARPLDQPAHLLVPRWRAWRARWQSGRRGDAFEPSDDDRVWQCWAMPRALALQLAEIGQQLGWASVRVEPRSVSLQRASAFLSWPARAMPADAPPGGDVSPERLAAWGAAHHPPGEAPDLLRHPSGRWRGRGARWVRVGWPWLLAWGLTAVAGYALGGGYQQRWAREQEEWTQRLRELHATEEAFRTQQRDMEQARQRQQEQAARVAYNGQFSQVLLGGASTVPPGVRWQQLSVRPQIIDVHAQTVGSESFTRWMDQWSQALPPRAQQHLQWQPEVVGPGQPALSPSLWGVRVQWSWNALSTGRQ